MRRLAVSKCDHASASRTRSTVASFSTAGWSEVDPARAGPPYLPPERWGPGNRHPSRWPPPARTSAGILGRGTDRGRGVAERQRELGRHPNLGPRRTASFRRTASRYRRMAGISPPFRTHQAVARSVLAGLCCQPICGLRDRPASRDPRSVLQSRSRSQRGGSALGLGNTAAGPSTEVTAGPSAGGEPKVPEHVAPS